MGKINRVSLIDFSGGMKTNTRASNAGQFNQGASLVKHFDIYSDPRKLIPVPSWTEITDTASRKYEITSINALSGGTKLYAIGKPTTNWFSDDWGYRIAVTYESGGTYIKTTNVDTYAIDLSAMPAGFWSNVNSDGSDVRVTDDDGVTQIACHVESIDTGTETGWLFVKGTIQDIFVYYGNSNATALDENSTYGKADTFSQHDRFFGFSDDDNYPDAVHSLDDDATFSPVTAYTGTGVQNQDLEDEAADNPWTVFGGAGKSLTVFAIIKGVNPTAITDIVDSANVYADVVVNTNGHVDFSVTPLVGSGFTLNGTTAIGTSFTTVTCVWESNVAATIYINGTQDVTVSKVGATGVDSGSAPMAVNVTNDYILDMLVLDSKAYSADKVTTLDNIFRDNGNCFTIGSQVAKASITTAAESSGVKIYEYDIANDEWNDFTPFGSPITSRTSANTLYSGRGTSIALPSVSLPAIHVSTSSNHDYAGTEYISGSFDDGTTTGITTTNWNDLYDNTSDSLLSIASTVPYPPLAVVAPDKRWYMSFGTAKLYLIQTNGVDTGLSFTPFGAVTSMCQYGPYLAVASVFRAESIIELWDQDSSTEDEFINLGVGEVRVVGNIEEILFAVIDGYTNDTILDGGRPIMDIRIYTGNSQSRTVYRYNCPATMSGQYSNTLDTPINGLTQKTRNSVLFYAKLPTNETPNQFIEGLWAAGRNDVAGGLAISVYSDTATEGNPVSLTSVGNQVFMVIDDGKVYKIDDDGTYSETSSLETLIFDGGDVDRKKRLNSVEVNTEPLDASQTITLSYRKDNETTWTTITTQTTDNSITKKSTKITSTNANLPSFNEIQFKIESSGGSSAITGFSFTYEDLMNVK